MNSYHLFHSIFTVITSIQLTKGNQIPPPKFFSDVILKYLDIPDVVMSIYEDTSVPVDEYAVSMYEKDVFTSFFEWNSDDPGDHQFLEFIKVVASGKQRTIVFFLDDASARMFFEHAHKVKEKLPLPCFYRWIFFGVNGIDMKPLQRFNTSAVCWKSIFVKEKQKTGNKTIGSVLPANFSNTFTIWRVLYSTPSFSE
ncbi:hypothetical protein AVEN_154019-1 [Araneus ventricosus]|uniref:Uncharacterized protein n=1 Tax=Araneus ventricosus TaxID=182803 RepID=A0A4Y2IJW8_ARAVE|nr:hypothetical protein AVEN_154019-1 [Araneus ventricosus]